LLLCSSHSTWGADKAKSAFDEFDGSYEQSYAEVPVESIQQFVQIYGIVKENYVVEKMTMHYSNKPSKAWSVV
jgi:hypothetical protein